MTTPAQPDPVLKRLGELSAYRNFVGRASLATPAATSYLAARACAEYEPRNRALGRQVRDLRATWEGTLEYAAAVEADRQYMAFTAEHETDLAAYVEPRREGMTPDEYEARARELEWEVERTAPLVPDSGQPAPWDHQLALDDLQGFYAAYHDEVYLSTGPEPAAGS